MSQSTPKAAKRKAVVRPRNPKGFPLSPHPSGKWQKKINGRIYYFGRWANRVGGQLVRVDGDGRDDALADYNARRPGILAGRPTREEQAAEAAPEPEVVTIKYLVNRFLTAKSRKVESKELAPRTFAEYQATGERVAQEFGKERSVQDLRVTDFEKLRTKLARRFGPVRLGNEIHRVRSIFKYGFENGVLERPVVFGTEFKRPSKKVMRVHRAKKGEQLLDAAEIRALIGAATPQMKAMVLLGINCGFGNADCASLTKGAINLKTGWVNFPRPKTGIPRRSPLWPETVDALKAAIECRAEPADPKHANLVFLTWRGQPWVRIHLPNGMAKEAPNDPRVDAVGLAFRSLKAKAGIVREGIGFYVFRHVLRTVCDGTRDFPAINLIMGHADDYSMASAYRERIDDDRLRAVTDYVRQWLFES